MNTERLTEALDNAAASLETMLAHFGHLTPPGDDETRERVLVEARAALAEARAGKPPRLCIRLEGGAIQDVFSDAAVDVLVIDYDTEGAAKDELFPMPQDEEGTIEPCYLQEFVSNVMPKEVERINAAITEYEEKGWAKAGM